MPWEDINYDPFKPGPISPPTKGTSEGKWQDVDYDPFGGPPKEPSYLSKIGAAAKVGLKGGVAGAMKMYEIPTRGILERTGLAAPGTFASEQLKPTPEEEEAGAKAGIPGEIVKGFAGIPGALAKYGPLMAVAPAGILGTALLGGAEEAAEQLSGGKKIRELSPLEIIENAAVLGIFKGIEPLGRAARSAILAGTFGTQAFGETYAQTKDIAQSLKAGIAPGVIGAGMGLMGGKGREERPIPRPVEEGIKQIPTIPESRYEMGTPGYPRPEELPYPIVPYRPGGPMVDTGEFFGYKTVPPRPEPTRGLGWTPTGTPPPPPDWVREGRDIPPPQYPPVPFEPKAPGLAPEPSIPPAPTVTPPLAEKALERPARPATDRQMASVRENAEKIGGLSIDLIKRWTGLGTKRSNAIFEDLVNKGEVEGGGPESKFPWKLKEGAAPAEPSGLDPDVAGQIREFRDIVTMGESAAGRYQGPGADPELLQRFGSSMQLESMVGMKTNREEVLDAIKKGLGGEDFGKSPRKKGVSDKDYDPVTKKEKVWKALVENGKKVDEERKAQDALDRERAEIATRNLAEEKTRNDLTKHIDDEIMGLREQLYEEGHSRDEVSNAISKVTKALEAEAPVTDIPEVETQIRSLLTTKVEPPLSPTAKDQFALPGIKQGLEMAGAKEGAAPTLKGTPLAEAAMRAEAEKVQPKLPFGIGDSVTGTTAKGDFKGIVAEINPDGSILIGAPDGRMMELPADKVKLPGRLPAVMADGEVLIGSGTHGSIPAERYSEAKDVKIGWIDTEGNFTENKPSQASTEPTSAQAADPLREFVENKGVDYDALTDKQKARWKNEFEKPKARTGEVPKEPLNRESVKSFADERLKELKNAPETEIVDSVEDIPERIRNQMEENARNNIKGVYDPMSKKIYLAREMMGSEEDVIRTIEHEAVGHYATEAYLGKEGDSFFNRVYMKYGRTGLKDIAEERGFDLNTREGRIDAAKEKVAQLAESGENPGLLKQFYSWIREQVRKVFPDLKVSDSEIQTMIMKSRQSLVDGELRAREAQIEGLKTEIRAAQFSIAGKIKEAGRATYEEEIKAKGEGFKSTWEWIKHVVSPTSGVDVKSMDMMMKMTGERAKANARVEVETEKGVNELNKLSPQEQIDLIDKIQMGYKFDELPENLREYARLHRSIEDSVLIKANAILAKSDKAAVIAYLEGHVRNFWKVVPRGFEDEIQRKGFEGLSRRPLEGTRAPLHHQYWTLKEGMANGGVPFTTNLLEITRLNYADTYKLLTAHDMWNTIGEMGNRKFIKFGEAMPEGFMPLNDRIANKYFPPAEAGRWVVEENVGRLLQNYLSRDLVRENPLLRGIMGIKNITTALELGFSGFHASFIAWETIASQMGLGMRKIWNQGMIREGLKDFLEAPITPYKTFKMGKDIARLFKDPDEFIKSTGGEAFLKQFPEAREMISDLFYGGGSVRMNESYRIKAMNVFKENIESKNYTGAALRSIPALSEFMMKPLFENYIPAIKRAVFFKEFSNELLAKNTDLVSGKITRPELARNVWSFVENRFGEMNFDNLWWNRTFKSGLQMGVRSVTWKLGNIRAYGKAVTGQSGELLAAMREGRMPKLTPEFAWVMGLGAVTAAMASIAQYAFTGKTPENWKDLVYPQIDQAGGRISLPTYMRDLFHLAHAPTKYVTSSMAGWFGRFTDVLNNKDFYGVAIHDPNENVIMQRVDDLIHMVPLPFSIQSMKRMREEGEAPTRQAMGFLGATRAPYWIERSEAEQKASDLKAAHLPVGGRSPADFERGRLLKKYATMYQDAALRGEPTDEVMRQFHTDIAKGNLHMADLLKFRQRITREPLTNSVMNLPFKDILQVWNVASSDEKKKLYPILNRKFYGIRSPEDRALYFQKMRQIQDEVRIGG